MYIATCGAINWDTLLFVENFPLVGGEVTVKEITRVSGGTAANVAVAAARLLGPGKVALLGALGNDEIGKKQLEILRDEGVVTRYIKILDEAESGQAYIVVDTEGNNIIHTFFGANLEFSPRDLEEEERVKMIRRSKVAVIMDPPMETAAKLAEISKENKLTVIWDPGVHIRKGLSELSKTLCNTDYFILNHVEFKELMGTCNPEEIADKINEINDEVKFIVKRGREGSTLTYSKTKETIQFKGINLERYGFKVVSSVGSGDAFIGSFAAAKAMGKSDLLAFKWANAAGAFKATKKETRGSPRIVELLSFMEMVQISKQP